MRYFSICSGIEAATVAWHPLGWTPVGFAEIDRFAAAVLAARFGSNMPGEALSRNGVPNHGDFTRIDVAALPTPIDLLVGGTPCQTFSFAGKRLSLSDARGNLTLAYAVLAHELARSHGLRNALWENVPGVLSTDDNAFGCFLGALVGADDAVPLPEGIGRWPDAGMVAGPRARAAWRVFDAQYFGLAQRRERVFVVVDFGNGADPAAVLFEPQGLQGNSPPRREAGERVAGSVSARTQGGGGLGTDFECDGGLVAKPILAGGHSNNPLDENLVAEPFSFKASHYTRDKDGAPAVIAPPLSADADRGDQDTLVLAFSCKDHGADAGNDLAPTLRAMGHSDSHANAGGQVAVAYDLRGREGGAQFEGPHDTANMRAASGGSSRSNVQHGWAVRRLTPVECARLQGFPDHHARIPWRGKPAEDCPDGGQYKTFGNSMAVNVMAWIGRRIGASFDRVPSLDQIPTSPRARTLLQRAQVSGEPSCVRTQRQTHED